MSQLALAEQPVLTLDGSRGPDVPQKTEVRSYDVRDTQQMQRIISGLETDGQDELAEFAQKLFSAPADHAQRKLAIREVELIEEPVEKPIEQVQDEETVQQQCERLKREGREAAQRLQAFYEQSGLEAFYENFQPDEPCYQWIIDIFVWIGELLQSLINGISNLFSKKEKPITREQWKQFQSNREEVQRICDRWCKPPEVIHPHAIDAIPKEDIDELMELVNRDRLPIFSEGLNRLRVLRKKIPLARRLLIFCKLDETTSARLPEDNRRGLLLSETEKSDLCFRGNVDRVEGLSREQREAIMVALNDRATIRVLFRKEDIHEILSDFKRSRFAEKHLQNFFKVVPFDLCLEIVYGDRCLAEKQYQLELPEIVRKEGLERRFTNEQKTNILIFYSLTETEKKAFFLNVLVQRILPDDLHHIFSFTIRHKIFRSLVARDLADRPIEGILCGLFAEKEMQYVGKDIVLNLLHEGKIGPDEFRRAVTFDEREKYFLSGKYRLRDLSQIFSEAEKEKIWQEHAHNLIYVYEHQKLLKLFSKQRVDREVARLQYLKDIQDNGGNQKAVVAVNEQWRGNRPTFTIVEILHAAKKLNLKASAAVCIISTENIKEAAQNQEILLRLQFYIILTLRKMGLPLEETANKKTNVLTRIGRAARQNLTRTGRQETATKEDVRGLRLARIDLPQRKTFNDWQQAEREAFFADHSLESLVPAMQRQQNFMRD